MRDGLSRLGRDAQEPLSFSKLCRDHDVALKTLRALERVRRELVEEARVRSLLRPLSDDCVVSSRSSASAARSDRSQVRLVVRSGVELTAARTGDPCATD